MQIIVTNYSRNGLALIAEITNQIESFEQIIIVNVDTGWQAQDWLDYEKKVKAYVERLGFKTVTLEPRQSFKQLVEARREFPSSKFQWCATFLKGITLLDWLQEVDSAAQAQILLPAYRALGGRYRYLKSCIDSSEHYGGRRVCYPLIDKSHDDIDVLLQTINFSFKNASQECRLCVMSKLSDYLQIADKDLDELSLLEKKINQGFNPDLIKKIGVDSSLGIKQSLLQKKLEKVKLPDDNAVQFGCGAPYGCGL